MTTAGPWSVKGIDPKARELAKDLARRSGMTLGEWLNQMIIEGEGEGEDEAYAPPPSPVRASPIREIRLSPDAELKRVGRALDVLTQRMETAENRSTLAISGIDQQVMGVLSRIEGVERDRAAAAARFDSDLQNVKAAQAKVSEALNRVSQEEGLRVEVMRSLEGALGRVAEKFHDVEGKTRAVMTEVREEVSNSSRRVDRLETRVEAEPATADGKLDRMGATLRDLAGHVDQGERRSAQAIDRIGREVMRVAQSLGDRVGSVEARTAEAVQQMGGEMARIAEAMEHRMGRADQIQAEHLENLGSEIAKIAERLADRIASAERRSAAAIDDVGEQVGRVTERLNERYEASHGVLAERIRASEERTAKLLEEARETLERRLIETQRRGVLESVLADTRRIADEQDAARAGPAASPVPNDGDPFAPLTQAPADGAENPASRPAAMALPDPFAPVVDAPFGRFEDRYGDFAGDGVEAESFSPPPAPEPAAHKPPASFEPQSTRDVVAAARAAARLASERPDALARGKRRGPDLAGSIIAPPLENGERSGFSFSLPKRKKKQAAVNLRSLVVMSGTAAALAVTGVGATLYWETESGSSAERVNHGAPAPSAAQPDEPRTPSADAAHAATAATSETPPADTLAVALTAPPVDAGAAHPAAPARSKLATPASPAPVPNAPPPAPTLGGLDARAYYNTAIQRLQVGDSSGTDQLEKAANLGFAPAQFYLAKLYETGDSGIKKDLHEARRWTQRAAEAGDARAMHNLALYEFNGEGGAADRVDAAHWFKRAADLGVADSQYNLGRLYENGYGVPENKTEAYKWYLIAAGKGDRDAHVSAEALRGQLPADEAATAERAAEGFLAQKPSTVQTARTP